MKEHIWKPVDAVYDGWCIQITYQNELGEEFVYTTCDELMNSEEHSGLHAICWPRCCGDWPGCRSGCCAYNALMETWAAQEKAYCAMPPMDPFSFMLNHFCSIDDNNFEGHFCIHFSGSKTHGSKKVDDMHQQCVKEALKHSW